MMFKDLTGMVFTNLTVIKRIGSNHRGSSVWLCKCSCGKETSVITYELNSGSTKSCGCLRAKRIGDFSRTHGMSNTTEYSIWCDLIKRTENENREDYQRYGGRGIKMSKEWRESFDQFYSDMGDRPSKDHSIDRINNDGNYESGNCRWTVIEVQARNKRNNIWIQYNSSVMILEDWAKALNVTRSALKNILKKDSNYKIMNINGKTRTN